jgi:phosphonate metabolism transcriptional regulator PhnF
MALNRFSERPLYRQLSDELEARVAEQYTPGDRLPSEQELAAEFDVNRLTVRQALAELTLRGLVQTVQGKGSFVSAPPLRYDVSGSSDASFSHMMEARGHRVEVRRLRVTTDDDPAVLRALRTRRPVRRFELIRLVDELPWSLTTTCLAATRFRNLDRHWSGETSLYDALDQHYGIRMVRAERSFSAVPADAVDAEHLAIPLGFPVLDVRGLDVDESGRPVAVVHHRFRGDRAQFTVEMQ